MSDLERRIARAERAERAVEWVAAQATVDRLLRWKVATGAITPAKEDAIRTELRALAPFATYVAGRWVPPADLTPDSAASGDVSGTIPVSCRSCSSAWRARICHIVDASVSRWT